MNETQNRRIVLAKHCKAGEPDAGFFRLEPCATPEPGEGELALRLEWLSVDPYMRGRMRGERTYIDPFAEGQPVEGGAVARVLESRNKYWKAGDRVTGMLKWQEVQASDGNGLMKADVGSAPPSAAVGALGMPGLTAYFGMLDIGNPKKGETVLVSGAAGAVGSVAGQIARIPGCRVVGTAGGAEKARWLKEELGFDEAIDYKAEGDLAAALKKACPGGVDVYFDNVGGRVTEIAMDLINRKARIVLCGQISHYNATETPRGPENYLNLIVKSAMMKGFIVTDYLLEFPEALLRLRDWADRGEIKIRETVVEGFENAPKAFLGLFHGDNIGKMVVKV